MRIPFTFLFALASLSLVNLQAETKPNFVFFLVDDLAKMDMSLEGSEFYETPNIDKLGKMALRFERGYSACQVCSPSRAAIQTGKTPARVKITDYISVAGRNQPEQWNRNTALLPANYVSELALDEVTIAEALKDNGYRTFFAGKWHLGADGFTPTEQGYEENQGGYHFGTPPRYFSPYNNPKLTDDEPGKELPVRLAEETADFIKRKTAANEPYYAMLSFYSVHGPIHCSEDRFKKFQAKAEAMGLTDRTDPRFLFDRTQEVRQVQDHPIYAGMMAALDDAIGVVLDAVEKSGQADNTVIIFTSDNGGVSSGDGYATSALPLRGGKGRQWEGGIRQPYYIYWPGVTKGGTTDALATGMDFYPTMLEIAGVEALPDQHLDGVSLVPVLKGEEANARTLYWHYPHYGNQGGEPSAIIQDSDWKLIHYFEDGRNELYQVDSDIGEQNDMAAKHPEKVKAMEQALKAWQKEVGADFPTTNPQFDADAEKARRATMTAEGNPKREAQHAGFMKADYVPAGGWWDKRKPGQPKGKGKGKK